MIYLGPLLAVSFLLAYSGTKCPLYFKTHRNPKSGIHFWCLQNILLLIILTVFSGMRNSYNDTEAYIYAFTQCPTIWELKWTDMQLARNPLYSILSALVKTFTNDYHILFLICALFVNYSVLYFLKKYSKEYSLSVYIYIASGCFTMGMAAQKQILAMAILLWAVSALLEDKHTKFLLLVLCATLFHFYAFVFIVAYFLRGKPWSKNQKIAFLFACAASVFFDRFIELFLGAIEFLVGRASIYDGVEMNPYRIVFHAVLPLVIFIYRNRIYKKEDCAQQLFANAAIMMFTVLIIASGGLANEVGRVARYFEIISIPAWSYIVYSMKDARQKYLAYLLVLSYYFVFFYYQFGVASVFENVWS